MPEEIVALYADTTAAGGNSVLRLSLSRADEQTLIVRSPLMSEMVRGVRASQNSELTFPVPV